MPFREGATGTALHVSFKLFGEVFFRQGNIRHEFPRFEFVGVGRFSRIVLGEFRDGVLGRISLETPVMAEREKMAVQIALEKKNAELAEKKLQRKNNFKQDR